MKSVETEGKTIEEAISKACEELKASREDLEIEVLTNGSSGFLGLVGAKKAQIRATVRETAVAAEKETGLPADASSHMAAETARKTLQDLLGLLEIEAGIDLKEEPERIVLNIKGDGSGLLIGRKGQTLDALEYLINKIVHKGAEDKKRIIVDTENYRSRREESLVLLAHRLGDKAKRLGRPVTISPMSAHDRRLIHLALQDDKTLHTRSTGTGLYRKIVISPEKKPS
jgi:spoIIIJ-associated protein